MESIAIEAAGHHRSPATLPGYHQGRPPRNKGMRYRVDQPAGDRQLGDHRYRPRQGGPDDQRDGRADSIVSCWPPVRSAFTGGQTLGWREGGNWPSRARALPCQLGWHRRTDE